MGNNNKKQQRQDQSKVQTQPVTPAPGGRREDQADNAPTPGSRNPQQTHQGPSRPKQDEFDRQPNRRDESSMDQPNDDDAIESETERQIRPRE